MTFKKIIVILLPLIILVIPFFAYFNEKHISTEYEDSTWINDLGYKEDQVHQLTFNWQGDRSCPEVPIKINNKNYKVGFDTGCGVGIFFTDAIEHELNYSLLGKSEALNRDGSHRGWNKRIIIDSFISVSFSILSWLLFFSLLILNILFFILNF